MTIQVADELVLAGKRFLAEVSTPDFKKVLPEFHLGIREATSAELRELYKDDNSVFGTSACWRGYIATWNIEDRRLSLLDLRGFYAKRAQGPISAEWFTGTLDVPMGECICRPQGVNPNIYEQELCIEVTAGLVARATLTDRKCTVPAELLDSARRQAQFFLKYGGDHRQPILPPSSLREALGDVEERSTPASWWKHPRLI